MRLSVSYIIIAIAILASAAQAQQACVISGYINKNDLTPAADHILRVNATVPLDPVSGLFSGGATADTSDASGYIEMTVTRNSIIYVSCDPRRPVRGFPSTPPGIALVVPDAPTHQLAALLPPSTVPPLHIVAIPALSNYGDSIRIADSLARVALDSASAARQDLLIAIAQLQAQLDTAGAARTVIESDIAALYAQLSAVSGQIAIINADLAALGVRIDSVEAHNAQQDASIAGVISDNLAQDVAIAAAGKWEQTGDRIKPKAGIGRVDVGPAHAIYPQWFWTQSARIDSLLATRLIVGNPSTTIYSANFGGNVYVNPDSGISATTYGYGIGGANYLKFEGTGGAQPVLRGSAYNRYVSPIHLFYDWDSRLLMTMKSDSMTIYKPTTFLGTVTVPLGTYLNFGNGMTLTNNSAVALGSSRDLHFSPGYGIRAGISNANLARIWGDTGYWIFGTSSGNGANRALVLRDDSITVYKRTHFDDFIFLNPDKGFGGHIKQHKDSIANLGTVRTPRIVYDSLGYAETDSIYYQLSELTIFPVAKNYVTHFKYGKAKLIFTLTAASLTNTPHVRGYSIVMDSATQTRWHQIITVATGNGYPYPGGEGYSSIRAYRSDFVPGVGSSVWAFAMYGSSTPTVRMIKRDYGYENAYKAQFEVPMGTTGAPGWGHELTMEVEVYFRCPIDQQPTFHVKLDEL